MQEVAELRRKIETLRIDNERLVGANVIQRRTSHVTSVVKWVEVERVSRSMSQRNIDI